MSDRNTGSGSPEAKDGDARAAAKWAELEKYRRIFHAMPDYGTFSNLETGMFIDVNPGFEKLIGYKREEVIGRTATSINLWVDIEDRNAAVEALKRDGQTSVVTRLRKRNGEQALVEGSLATFDMNGELLLVAVVRDITARRREEEELARYRTQLEQLVAQRTAELERALQKVNELAANDELTGVGNRRDLNNRLFAEGQMFERIRQPACIAVLDMDGLKGVNDRLGHAVGDEVIKAFAHILKGSVRAADYLARYGGDEFVILLRETSPERATAVLQRMREAVERFDWTRIDPSIAMTTSIGLAELRPGEAVQRAFDRADQALYRAKASGRNRIEVANARRESDQ